MLGDAHTSFVFLHALLAGVADGAWYGMRLWRLQVCGAARPMHLQDHPHHQPCTRRCRK